MALVNYDDIDKMRQIQFLVVTYRCATDGLWGAAVARRTWLMTRSKSSLVEGKDKLQVGDLNEF